MEKEYSKYLINKLFSDYENNYEYEIMSYEQFIVKKNNYKPTKGEKKDERISTSGISCKYESQ